MIVTAAHPIILLNVSAQQNIKPYSVKKQPLGLKNEDNGDVPKTWVPLEAGCIKK